MSAANQNVSNNWCNGHATVGIVSRSFPLTITDQLAECIQDGLGLKIPHSCWHRRYKTSIARSNGEVQAVSGYPPPTGAPGFGVSSEPTPNWRTYLNAAFYHPQMTGSWDVNPQTTPLQPQGWLLDMTAINESSLKETVLERAMGLKADILLNLIEANQVWPSIKSLSTCIPEMAYQWGRLRKVVKTASGAFLAWRFGVSPIISDMENVHRYLPKLANDISRHEDGDKHRVSIVARPTMFYTPFLQTSSLNNYVVWKKSSQGRITATPEVRYVLTVRPRMRYRTEIFSKLDLFMKRFATSPASLAWEKVPFSFVVDWFVDLRGVLRGLDKMVGHSPYEIVSFTRSLSYGVATDTFFSRFSPCDGSVLYDDPVGTTDYKHYERTPVSASVTLPTANVRFGKSQAGISAALILQQLSKLRAKR